jgi:plastocyanin
MKTYGHCMRTVRQIVNWGRAVGITCAFGSISMSTAAADLTVVVGDADGKPVVDAVVALFPFDGGTDADTRRPDKSVDQINKRFRPSVLALQTGTLVYFPNSDNIRHQIYSFSDAKKFETKLYSGKTAAPVLFDKAGVVVLGCNIHDSMQAYLYVLDTPYFAKTDGAGSATISAPIARFVMKIWHPQFQTGRNPMSREYEITKPQESLYQTLLIDRPPDTLPSSKP